MCCSLYYTSILLTKNNKGPPRYCIANKFLIGYIYTKTCNGRVDITESVSEMIIPVRQFSYVLNILGENLETLKGHHMFFENNLCHSGALTLDKNTG